MYTLGSLTILAPSHHENCIGMGSRDNRRKKEKGKASLVMSDNFVKTKLSHLMSKGLLEDVQRTETCEQLHSG